MVNEDNTQMVNEDNTQVTNESNAAEVVNNEATIVTTTDTNSALLLNSSIDSNVCCMCFVNYEDDVLDGCGADWIECACGRWLHVDCAEDCITDRHGKNRYCPYCLEGLIQ